MLNISLNAIVTYGKDLDIVADLFQEIKLITSFLASTISFEQQYVRNSNLRG